MKQTFISGLLALGLIGSLEVHLTNPVLASTSSNHLVVDAHTAESFDALINEASEQAQRWIESWFHSHPNTTQIELMISGARNGQIVPLLKVSVSQEDWQQQPQVEYWLSHFSSMPVTLLGFQQPNSSSSPSDSIVQTANSDPGKSFDGLPLVPDNLARILENNPPPVF